LTYQTAIDWLTEHCFFIDWDYNRANSDDQLTTVKAGNIRFLANWKRKQAGNLIRTSSTLPW
jgi:hypothetical protein